MNNYLKDIIVVENSILKNQQDDLEKTVTEYTFPWFFYEGTILSKDVEYSNDCIIQIGTNPPQFTHYCSTDNSLFVDHVAPILNTLAEIFNKDLQILKLKFNLLTKSDEQTHHWPHADIDNFKDDIRTAIYYVTNSDGPTFIFKEFAPKIADSLNVAVKVTPEKGKMIIFDSRRFHASSSPVDNNTRIVLNIVFKIPKD